MGRKYYFTSESVAPGHPDKICDQVSDAILDAILSKDPHARVACECATKTGFIIVFGEITTSANIDYEKVVRETIREIGWTAEFGFDPDQIAVIISLSKQSADIAIGVNDGVEKEQGAGDQGMMFGYATNETEEFMPLPILLAHKLIEKTVEVRKKKIISYLGPDAKSQVTVEYIDGKPIRVDAVVLSAQHKGDVDIETVRRDILEKVIRPVCGKYLDSKTRFFINPTGRFVIGGPVGDSGLTGRKIIVDSYGSFAHQGGGCFSGKDPSKVDRSAAYAARYIAKNIVAAGLADRCEVQLSYAIGIAEPISIYVNCFNTNKISEEKIEEIVRKHFPIKPKQIIEHLNLKRPIYKKTAALGHFGRADPDFSWERLDKVEILRKELN